MHAIQPTFGLNFIFVWGGFLDVKDGLPAIEDATTEETPAARRV
jgi:hypothetical protein